MNGRRSRLSPAVVPVFLLWLFSLGYLFSAAVFASAVLGVWIPAHVLATLCLLGLATVSYGVVFTGLDSASSVGKQKDRDLSKVNAVAIVVGLLAVLAVFVDRYHFRGVDYFALGVAGARAALAGAGQSGSPLSVLGNLLAYVFVIPLINALYEWEQLSVRERVVSLVGSLLCALLLSLLMGGRTVLLMVVALVVSAFVGRKILRLSFLPSGIRFFQLLFAGLIVIVLMAGVFYLRAATFASGDSAAYVEGVCRHVTVFAPGEPPSCAVATRNGGVVQEWANYLVAVLLYAFHAVWVSEAALRGEQGASGSVLLSGVSHLFLERFGVGVPSHAYSGYFVPLVSALFYDLGVLGFLAFAIAAGGAWAVFVRLLVRRFLWIGRFGFTLAFGAALLSLLISPSNLPGFILAGICVAIFGGIDRIARCLRAFRRLPKQVRKRGAAGAHVNN